MLVMRHEGITAQAQLHNGKFFVLKGSQARAQLTDGQSHELQDARSDLMSKGLLRRSGDSTTLEFTEDVPFTTQAEATMMILGRLPAEKEVWHEAEANPSSRAISPDASTGLPLTWQPLFHELALKILEFQDRQPELVELLKAAGVNVNHDEGPALSEIDPFTFFSLVLKRTSDSRTIAILAKLKERLNLQSPLPEDLNGVPWSNPMSAWFFSYRSKRQKDDIPTLWSLAHQALGNNVNPETFEKALNIRQVKLARLTQGLFWLNPDVFLPLNSVVTSYLAACGVPNADKVTTLQELNQVLSRARVLAPNFPTLSYRAWVGKNPIQLAGDQFPFSQFVAEASDYQGDRARGNEILDNRYAPLLLELCDNGSSEALRPSRNPYTGSKTLAVKIGMSQGEQDTFSLAWLVPFEFKDYVVLPAGLTVEAGFSDGKGDTPRIALQEPEMFEKLLGAMLHPAGVEQPPTLTLNREFGDLELLPLIPERENDIRRTLQSYAAGVGKSRRLRIGLSLTPAELEHPNFLNSLSAALAYLDQLLTALRDVAKVNSSRFDDVTSEPSPSEIQPNQVLYGPPGTGKTFRIVDEVLAILKPEILQEAAGPEGRPQRKAAYDELVREGRVSFVTFHQSFGYEDFIEGIKPYMNGNQVAYRIEDGIFLQAVRAADGQFPFPNPECPQPQQKPQSHVLVIDEINRGNIAKVFGELLTLLEEDKRAGAAEALSVILPLSRRPLSVPRNLFVIGTMNTADRSLTTLDAALRRRFIFKPVWPQPELLKVLELDEGALDLRKFLYALNSRIEVLHSKDHVIGHAYLMHVQPSLKSVEAALRDKILPLLEEYFFDDLAKVREVLADDRKPEDIQFVQQMKRGSEVRYRLNDAAFKNLDAYTQVYNWMSEAEFPFGS